ncbi:hypothetical protein K443DRAFT_674932 [Laccaria amethystina LaAM-08-1]|uniref:Uncharacterized protein n=1 Tax=Laccaria amethystina LaAM-08-1 TaxID=1095629 RepID=A0A0C9XKT0_9AGAR|nr:hypothetical protein K443DRAFT_674932 [Laccaria amethystina LaAM-08-1]
MAVLLVYLFLYFALFFSHFFASSSSICSPLHPSFLSSRVARCNAIHLHSVGGAPFITFHPSAAAPLPCATSVSMNALPHHLGTPITPYFSIMPNLLNRIAKMNQIQIDQRSDGTHFFFPDVGSPELNQT